jgi:hypothetical protein
MRYPRGRPDDVRLAESIRHPGVVATLEHGQARQPLGDIYEQRQRAAFAPQHGADEQYAERLARDWHKGKLNRDLSAQCDHDGAAQQYQQGVHRKRGLAENSLGKRQGGRSLH